MADVKVMWQAPPVAFPEGTSPEHHYLVHLGALSAEAPLGSTEWTFLAMDPGDYPSSVESIAENGTVLGMAAGNTVHVPAPVMVHLPVNVTAAVV